MFTLPSFILSQHLKMYAVNNYLLLITDSKKFSKNAVFEDGSE